MNHQDTKGLVAAFNSGIAELSKEQTTGETINAFQKLHSAASAPGELDSALKETIAIAIAVATHCDGCIAWHVGNAVRAGATRAQVLEAVNVSVMMGGGPALYYATTVTAALDSEGAA